MLASEHFAPYYQEMSFEGRLPRFVDTAAGDEVYGFADPLGRSELPGSTWQSGNMFKGSWFIPNCNMEDAVFNDTVWYQDGSSKLSLRNKEDDVFEEIFYNDSVRRLQAVEQLTLPPEYSTIPNTGAFSRFEHIWGSVLFVRQMCKKQGITGRQAEVLQSRTLTSDLAHTYGSHLGDWVFQGAGGPENQHDLELMQYLEAVGINDIFRDHDIEPSEVVFPEINDWVEASQPDLCVDRVDYGLREMNRWNDTIRMENFSVDDFTLTPEGMLAMVDQRRARMFSEGFLLLPQEHWSEPTHRFMIDMIMLRTKLFYAEGGAPRSWVMNPDINGEALVPLHEIHPRDLMYVTDPAQAMALERPNLGSHILDSIMKSVAQHHRQYVWPGRRERINQYMGQFSAGSYQNILDTGTYKPMESDEFNCYLDEYPATQPLGFAILSEQQAAGETPAGMIDFPQTLLKPRQVDPLVRVEGGFARLSELDPSYKHRLAEQKAQMLSRHVARIAIPDPATFQQVSDIVTNVEEHWKRRLETSRRMTGPELSALVKTSSREIFGRYPFLSFLAY